MSALGFQRACAWIFVVAFIVAAGSPARADNPSFDSATHQAAPAPLTSAEPFGLVVSALPDGPLQSKWRAVERQIAQDLELIAQCRSDRAKCGSPQAVQFLKIVEAANAQTGLARVGEINRAFNLAIRPVSDSEQYGVEDLWTSPLTTLTAGAGDCEDYAIAKLVALREAGVANNDLRIVILRETFSGEDHAVVAARVDDRWRMLDNRYFMMLEDSDVSKFRPVFAIDAEGAKRFEQPLEVLVATAGATTSPATSTVDQSTANSSTSAIAPSSVATHDFWQTHIM